MLYFKSKCQIRCEMFLFSIESAVKPDVPVGLQNYKPQHLTHFTIIFPNLVG